MPNLEDISDDDEENGGGQLQLTEQEHNELLNDIENMI